MFDYKRTPSEAQFESDPNLTTDELNKNLHKNLTLELIDNGSVISKWKNNYNSVKIKSDKEVTILEYLKTFQYFESHIFSCK